MADSSGVAAETRVAKAAKTLTPLVMTDQGDGTAKTGRFTVKFNDPPGNGRSFIIILLNEIICCFQVVKFGCNQWPIYKFG